VPGSPSVWDLSAAPSLAPPADAGHYAAGQTFVSEFLPQRSVRYAD
jgi:hypothetical protein